eukprot:912218_1
MAGILLACRCFVRTLLRWIHILWYLWWPRIIIHVGQYTPDDINTWCNGKYQEEFTYKEGSETRDWGTYFDYMIQAGIIYGAIHVLVILYCCVYKPIYKRH